MSPFAGTRVIPARWSEHHRPVVAGTQTAPATFHRITEGPAPYPLPDGWIGSRQVWAADVRVLEQSQRASDPVVADQPTTQRQYLVTAPLGGPALRAGERGDVVHVLGREMRILDILDGSLLFELDLICQDNLTQQNPD